MRVMAGCMSRLISFVIVYSSCQERKASQNYKLKNPCPQ